MTAQNIADHFFQILFEHSSPVDLGRLHFINQILKLKHWICVFGSLKQVPLEHNQIRLHKLRFYTFPDDGLCFQPPSEDQGPFCRAFSPTLEMWRMFGQRFSVHEQIRGQLPAIKLFWGSLRLLLVDSSHARFFSISRLNGIRKDCRNCQGICMDKVWVLPAWKNVSILFPNEPILKFCLKAFVWLSLRLAWWTALRTSTKVGDSCASSLQKAPVQQIHVSNGGFLQWWYPFNMRSKDFP